MAANTTPIFILEPKTVSCDIVAANTSRDGSGTLVTLFTAGANNSRVDFVQFISAQATPAANSAMVCRVFVTDTAGANPRLLSEVTLSSVTASNTAVGASNTIFYSNGLLLTAGQQLKVSKSVHAGPEDNLQCVARGGNY